MSLSFRSCMVIFALVLGGCATEPPYMVGEQSGLGASIKPAQNDREKTQSSDWKPVVLTSARAETRTTYTEPTPPKPKSYVLESGDSIRMIVYGETSLSQIYKIKPTGMISVPLIGRVYARGYTTHGLERLIRRKLGARYIRNPHVAIDVHRHRPFFIHGKVRNAGAFPYLSGMTVEAAAAVAGGFTNSADIDRIKLTRTVNGVATTKEVSREFIIAPGDTIFVAGQFF